MNLNEGPALDLPPQYPGGMRIGEEEINEVTRVMKSHVMTRYGGPAPEDGKFMVDKFEQAFAQKMGVPHAAAVSSGTAALICGLVAVGVGPGDEVLVPAFTYVATAEAPLILGAIPVICEIDSSLLLDPNELESRITKRTRAIIPVHMRGSPCAMDKIMEIAAKHRLFVVEDCAQACGVTFQGKPVGTFGDVGCFSFQFSKIITTAEGGMVISKRKDLFERALSFHSNHAWKQFNVSAPLQLWGINFRMSELPAAIGYVQLTQRIDSILSDMRRNWLALESLIRPHLSQNITLRVCNDENGDARLCFVLLLPDYNAAGRMVQQLRKSGLNTALNLYRRDEFDTHIYIHWSPILEQKSWNESHSPWCWSKQEPSAARIDENTCPKSLDLLGRTVHIDISPDFNEKHIRSIADAIIHGLREVKTVSSA